MLLEAFVAIKGGQITTIVTNCVQGLLSYPLYLVMVVFVLVRFSWFFLARRDVAGLRSWLGLVRQGRRERFTRP